MIRRAFWLTLGAGLGISAYRRVNRVVRELTPVSRARQPRALPALAGFVRDVREGMDLYAQRQRPDIQQHRCPEGHTLGLQQVSQAEAARNGRSGRNGSAAH